MGFFSKISEGLKKTRESLKERFDDVFAGGHVDEDLFDELEEALVLADTGAVTAGAICEELRKRVKKEGVSDPEKVREMMYDVVAEMLRGGQELNLENKPAIIMMIGVNGAGKTTTIGKLAKNFMDEGKKVVVVGSGMTGLETAETLVESSNKVTVVEMMGDVAPGVWFQHKDDLMPKLNKKGTEYYTAHKLCSIDDTGVCLVPVEHKKNKNYKK